MVKKLSKVLLCLMVAFSGMSFINAEETTPEIITAKGEQIAYLTGDDWGVGVSKTIIIILIILVIIGLIYYIFFYVHKRKYYIKLITGPTGSGKTYLACLATYRLLNYTPVKRVLFLVDRTALAEQTFDAFTPFKKSIFSLIIAYSSSVTWTFFIIFSAYEYPLFIR